MSLNLGAILVTVLLLLLVWYLWQEVQINRSSS